MTEKPKLHDLDSDDSPDALRAMVEETRDQGVSFYKYGGKVFELTPVQLEGVLEPHPLPEMAKLYPDLPNLYREHREK